jgi:hypothetical protein
MRPWAKISFALLLLCQSGLAQGFVNLDFEDATVILAGSPDMIEASSAIPGWAAYYGSSSNPTLSGTLANIFYDSQTIGGAGVFLDDANTPSGTDGLSLIPIQGSFSVFLEGSIPYAAVAASIGQTGTISNTARSLTFFAEQGGLQVTFNGQNIPFSAIGNGAGYTIYGADISNYAGQTGQLLFTAPGNNSAALLDNIQFSSSSVPEPSELALTALGALLLGFRRRLNSFIHR